MEVQFSRFLIPKAASRITSFLRGTKNFALWSLQSTLVQTNSARAALISHAWIAMARDIVIFARINWVSQRQIAWCSHLPTLPGERRRESQRKKRNIFHALSAHAFSLFPYSWKLFGSAESGGYCGAVDGLMGIGVRACTRRADTEACPLGRWWMLMSTVCVRGCESEKKCSRRCLLFCNWRLEISSDGLMFNLQGAAEHSRGSMGWILCNLFYSRFSKTNALLPKLLQGWH